MPRMKPVCGHWPDYVHSCLECKLYNVKFHTENIKRANNGNSVTGGMTDREYAHNMYASARAAGQDDPIPMNAEAAALAPAKGIFRKATGV